MSSPLRRHPSLTGAPHDPRRAVAREVNDPTPCPASFLFFSHSKRDVHTAARLARPFIQQQDPSSPILIHHMDPFPASYRMRVFLVLDPRPAVIQPVSRQRPGPLSARAKTTQCNAKQCFQNGARRERPLDGSEACASDVRGGLCPILCRACRSRSPVGLRLTDHR